MDIKKIKHIVVSGCSQTSDGQGGVPPTIESPSGGCSFIPSPDYATSEPASWAGMVAQSLNVSSIVNTAAGGHGNMLIATSLIEVLTRYPYPPDETLVLFNISWSDRLDIPCSFLSPDSSQHVTWSPDLIPFTYMDPPGSTAGSALRKIVKNLGIEHIESLSCIALTSLFNFLENQKFNYRFLLGGNFDRYTQVQHVIKPYLNKLIVLDKETPSIAEFVVANQLNKDIIHPNPEGHQVISNIVLQALYDNR